MDRNTWINKTKWVKQEDPNGCWIACCAMISGKTYDEVKSMVKPELIERESTGVGFYTTFQLLTDLGYACAMKCKGYAPPKERTEWPPQPFGDVHICEVQVKSAPLCHLIVILKDGTILDPATTENRTFADYERVHWLAAVVPINPEEKE